MGRRSRLAIVGAFLLLLALLWAALNLLGVEEEGVRSIPAEAEAAYDVSHELVDEAGPAGAADAPAPAPEDRRAVLTELVLRLRERDGAPFAGRVVLARSGAGLAERACDPHGVARFPASPGALDVLALHGTWVRGSWSLADGAGEHELVLAGAPGILGLLRVDGGAPGRPVELQWATGAGFRGIEEAPSSLFRSMGWTGQRGAPGFGVQTEPSGRFRVPGLPAGWTGRIGLPPELQTLDGEGAFPIEDAPSEIVLEATWRPAIRGRAIAALSGAPLAASVRYELVCEGGGFSGLVDCDEDGRFRIPILCGPIHSGSLRVTAGGLASEVRRLGEVPEAGVDLGDVPLYPNAGGALRVVDDLGIPVEGAIAVLGREPLACSEPSDAQGRITLPYVDAASSTSTVHALGHAPATFSTAALGETPLDVQLQRVHVLAVEIHGADGATSALRLVLTTESPDPFELPDADVPESFQRELGASAPRSRTSVATAAGTSVRLEYAGADRVTIVGLRPGVEIRLVLHGTDAAVLDGPRRVAIEGRGRQVVRLDAGGTECAVPLLVVDPLGEPLFGASVLATATREVLATTAVDGAALVRGVFAGPASLTVRKGGYVPADLTLADPCSPPDGDHRVVLRPGASFQVTARSQSGTAAPAESAEVQIRGRSVGSVRRVDAATFRIEDVPDEPMLVRLSVGGRTFERSIPGAADTTIAVPDSALVEVVWSGSPLVEDRWYVLALEPIAAEAAGPRRAALGAEWSRGVTLPAVFPGHYRACLLEPEPSGASRVELACEELHAGLEPTTLDLSDG